MDQLLEFCTRMLGSREAAGTTAMAAREAGGADPVQQLARAVLACRAPARQSHAPEAGREVEETLSNAVAGELREATGRLPQRQREALALRELLRLGHGQVAVAIGIDPAAVPALLARARLHLRAELRGAPRAAPECPERDRALRTIALRQDSEPVPQADDDWLVEHLRHCDGCARAHAAMLEASVCYRAWRVAP